jgi:hypothetical protein
VVAAAPRLVDLVAEGETMTQIYTTAELITMMVDKLDGTPGDDFGGGLHVQADEERPGVLYVDWVHTPTRYHHNFKLTVEFTHVDAD